jgi:hypothetical protein
MALAWWMLLIYPVIIEMVISTTRCYNSATVNTAKDAKIPSDIVVKNVSRMMAVPDIICGADGDFKYRLYMIFNICFIIIYMIFLPAFVYYRMSTNI